MKTAPFCLLNLLPLIFVFYSCEKDGNTGGRSSITFHTQRQDSINIGSLKSVSGVSVYIWFDGSFSKPDNFLLYKELWSADLVEFGSSNENFVKVNGLKKGHYGFIIKAKDKSCWREYSSTGNTETKTFRKNQDINITLY